MFSSQGQQGSPSFCRIAVENYCLPAIIPVTLKIKMEYEEKRHFSHKTNELFCLSYPEK